METQETCPQIPNTQTVEDSEKTPLHLSLLAVLEITDVSEHAGETQLAPRNGSAVLQVIVKILVRHLTCSRSI